VEFISLLPDLERQVSRIGFGCAGLGGYDYGPVDDTTSTAAIGAAIESGINFFDTADVYGFGRSERVLGNALLLRRNEVIIATKGGVRWDDRGRTTRTLDPKYLANAIEDSLRRLRTDYIDLYQLHWPDPSTSLVDALEPVVSAVEQGKIRAIGVCNFSFEHVAEATRHARISTIQVPMSLIERDWQPAIERCAVQFGAPAVCYNALAHGLLTGKFDETAAFGGTDLRTRVSLFQPEQRALHLRTVERVREAALRRGASCADVAIRWLLSQPGVAVALTGIKTPEQAMMNARSVELTLSTDELEALERVNG
jgi:aryl-alcohol dehydrogenase-like predicted oxidoreductase